MSSWCLNSTTGMARRWCFRRKEMVDATEDILTDNGVRAQGSPDMLEVWKTKSGTTVAK